jgi:mannose-6-phosphate isomerase-like protein (cupin superfamily)
MITPIIISGGSGTRLWPLSRKLQPKQFISLGNDTTLFQDTILRLPKEAVNHHKVFRPWGYYDSLDVGDGFQAKRICVKPGEKISLQKHKHRSEHWVVVSGTAKITCGDKIYNLEKNQSTYIPKGEVHRLENEGAVDLEIIEVQTGDYLGEDDIIRLEDDYERD